ncbi:serine/threonine-protein kinase [Nocardia brasiliensis]|uniref:serine/threonine-protein kinase n=1 Tax=Nocardia brasiliensis TaxID=37326 RepID=UPI002454BF87|nr:serine/threonine-protein kinase [Nocardia brasiliensis]
MTEQGDRLREALPAYDIGAELGRGGCGVVLAGTHRRLRRPVAIKQIPAQFVHDEQVRRRFVAEARVLAAIDHPHVVRVFDYLEHEELCLLVMEYLPGGTVGERFATDGYDFASAVAIALSCTAGLAAAHRHRVLHRDVKPANLMFAAGGAIKLTDFGIAKIVGGDETLVTKAGDIIGTPSYIAPEQARGQPLSPATDVYALATMLYQLLSGVLPFPPGEGPLAMLFAHAFDEPIPLGEVAPNVPEPIAAVVMRGLATDPAQRFDTAESFGIALARPAVHCWGQNWLAPVGIPVIGADTIVAAATGSSRPHPAYHPRTRPPPGSGSALPPTPVSDAEPAPPSSAPPRTQRGTAPPTVQWYPAAAGHPQSGTGSGPVAPPGRRDRPAGLGPEAVPGGSRVAGPPGGLPPAGGARPGVGSRSGYPAGAGPLAGQRVSGAATTRVRPRGAAPARGARLVELDRRDLRPIQQVVTLASPRVPLVIGSVLAVVAVVLGLVGSGPSIGGDLTPGAVLLGGVDPATGPVEIDLTKPTPLQVNGIDADSAALKVTLLGVPLGGETVPFAPGDRNVSLPAPVDEHVMAGTLTGELVLLRNGAEIATQRVELRTAQRSTTTVTAGCVVLLALFALAYLESNMRRLRSGRGGFANTLGLTVSAALLAVALLGARWVLLAVSPTVFTAAGCAVTAAAAGAAVSVAARRIGKRRRYLRRARRRVS